MMVGTCVNITNSWCGAKFAARARATWARLIRKVYEVDPLK
jgi:hypothetical protein